MDKKRRIWFERYKKPSIVIGTTIIIGIALLIGKSISNPNSGYLRNQSVDGLSFENAELEYKNGVTNFKVEVYNESGNVYQLKNISINLTGEDNKITTLVGYIGESLELDESKIMMASIDQDLSSSVNLKYVINK